MAVKFIFITGGVVSSLGKGIAAASLAAVLEARGLSVVLVKLDPYINVDPGTMSPYQHGEVFVTQDGAETDLDLGHYERFTTRRMSRRNNFTAGQVYKEVIDRERKGDYLGATVQVIPHITDEIKASIARALDDDSQVAIAEIGGTVGDIESLPFLEAARQMRLERSPEDTCFIHVTLLPFVESAGEAKTKPTQHSVKALREIGIQPDLLLCRVRDSLSEDHQKKIALFSNLNPNAVFAAPDVKSVYSLPINYSEAGIDKAVCARLNLSPPPPRLDEWRDINHRLENPTARAKIGIVGKYVRLTESYKSLNEAVVHAGIRTATAVDIDYINAEELIGDVDSRLASCDGLIIPGGFGDRGASGKMAAVQYARENGVPYLGICVGMQVAVIEFARHCAGIKNADSTEFNPQTESPVIAMLAEWKDAEGEIIRKGGGGGDLGGTMRLGDEECAFAEASRLRKIYGKDSAAERHRHRYELNNRYREKLIAAGMLIAAVSIKDGLCEAVELPMHPWFIACQFHPEFTSTPRRGHPLFCSFIEAARSRRESAEGGGGVRAA